MYVETAQLQQSSDVGVGGQHCAGPNHTTSTRMIVGSTYFEDGNPFMNAPGLRCSDDLRMMISGLVWGRRGAAG